MKILLVFFFSFSLAHGKGIFSQGKIRSLCEVQLSRLMDASQFLREFGNAKINFWYQNFDAQWMLSTFKSKEEIKKAIQVLQKFLGEDQLFADNLASFVEIAIFNEKLTISEAKALFPKRIGKRNIFFSNKSQSVEGLRKVKKHFVHFKIDPDGSVINAWKKISSHKNVSEFYQAEYRRVLFPLDFSKEELELLAKVYKPTKNIHDFKIFEDFIGFIKYRRPNYRLKAIAGINQIYRPIDSIKDSPELIAFKKFRTKVSQYQKTRVARRESWLKKDNGHLNEVLKRRAIREAKAEATIYKRLLAGCKGSHKSASLKSAASKFKKFKIGMSIGFGVWGYASTNYDKLDPNYSILEILKKEVGLKSKIDHVGPGYDPYWFRRFAYEIGAGLAFTWVNNLIITNPKTTAFHKAWNGYLKFAVLDATNAWGYDYLFGSDPSAVNKEFEKLRTSPSFQKKLKEILNNVEKNNPNTSIKQFLDKYFNMTVLNSKEDLEKLTLEDLESEEARELILQLLSERLYQSNMGSIPLFQTGNTGIDRWFFYRTYNIPNTVKSIAVDLLLFRIMCMASGPTATAFQKAQAFILAAAIQVTDKWISSKVLYPIRREAINQ